MFQVIGWKVPGKLAGIVLGNRLEYLGILAIKIVEEFRAAHSIYLPKMSLKPKQCVIQYI